MTHKLARARKRLRRHLAAGWARAVFAKPQRVGADLEERVESGPGLGDPEDDEFRVRVDDAFDGLMQAAEKAADEGFVKQTFVLDALRQVKIDARHGLPKLKHRDEASLQKTMGGKDRALRPDHSADLLRAIGIMNADGSISARHAKKYKQVNHLVEILRPVWRHAVGQRQPTEDAPLRVLDLACGNSYLDFVLAEALRLEEIPVKIVGVDAREDVVERSRGRTDELNLGNRLEFFVGRIAATRDQALHALGGSPEILVALHACDTATDEALALGLASQASAILCAPCCHAEVSRQLHGGNDSGPLVRHGLLRRAYADVLTDAVRVELLEAYGYDVGVLEFISSEHTAKNLLIRAESGPEADSAARAAAVAVVADRCATLGIRPALLELLAPSEHPPRD